MHHETLFSETTLDRVTQTSVSFVGNHFFVCLFGLFERGLFLLVVLLFVDEVARGLHEMMVVQAFRPDRLVASASRLVEIIMGKAFTLSMNKELDLASIVTTEVRGVWQCRFCVRSFGLVCLCLCLC